MNKYIKQYARQNALVALLVIICAGLQSGTSALLAFATNAIVDKQYQQFFFWVFVNLFCWCLLFVMNYITETYQEKTIQDMDSAMRADLMVRADSYNRFHHHNESYYISGLMNDINLVNIKIYKNFYALIQLIGLLIFSSVTIIFFQWKLIVLTLILGVISIYVPRILNRKTLKSANILRQSNEEALNEYSETVQGVDTFNGLNQSASILDRIKQASGKLKVSNVGYARTNAEIESLSGIISRISQTALLLYTGILIIQGETQIGTLMSITSLAGLFFTSTEGIGTLVTTIKGNTNLFEKFINDEKIDKGDTLPAIHSEQTVLDFENVAYAYANHENSIQDISFNIKANQKYFLTGPSGSGKSTIFALMLQHMQPTAGKIHYGIDLDALVYIPQKPTIFSDTIRYNLTLGQSYAQSEIDDVLKLTNLYEDFNHLDENIDTVLVDGGTNISGGQKQRIALARTLLTQPKYLLLDEATSAMDPINEFDILKKIYTLPDVTVVSIIHTSNQQVLNLADEILDMGEMRK
ncbi:ABC transporter ATP-binding protein [Weissella minor]|uniref:ABC transporter ATP-binding protein n=1 Tax=Weissella minor TaxID=1620 RepID=UPI003AF2987F